MTLIRLQIRLCPHNQFIMIIMIITIIIIITTTTIYADVWIIYSKGVKYILSNDKCTCPF